MFDMGQIDKIKKWLGPGSINIFGRPLSGKDSQGRRLAEMLDGSLIGGGELLRSETMPDIIKDLMRTGKLIPSDDYANIVLPYLKQIHLDDRPLILSSVGRWHGEEPGVIKALNESNHPLKVAVYLDIPNEESRRRWLARDTNNDRSTRYDDTEKILEVRFKEFEEKTLPVFDYYHNLNLLLTINGVQTRDEVTRDILDALSKLSDAA